VGREGDGPRQMVNYVFTLVFDAQA
jgi:hypothetical protein